MSSSPLILGPPTTSEPVPHTTDPPRLLAVHSASRFVEVSTCLILSYITSSQHQFVSVSFSFFFTLSSFFAPHKRLFSLNRRLTSFLTLLLSLTLVPLFLPRFSYSTFLVSVITISISLFIIIEFAILSHFLTNNLVLFLTFSSIFWVIPYFISPYRCVYSDFSSIISLIPVCLLCGLMVLFYSETGCFIIFPSLVVCFYLFVVEFCNGIFDFYHHQSSFLQFWLVFGSFFQLSEAERFVFAVLNLPEFKRQNLKSSKF
ncbi:hypothetical protein P9112_013337 [Eukaryota sp. TZLM1-RC]